MGKTLDKRYFQNGFPCFFQYHMVLVHVRMALIPTCTDTICSMD